MPAYTLHQLISIIRKPKFGIGVINMPSSEPKAQISDPGSLIPRPQTLLKARQAG